MAKGFDDFRTAIRADADLRARVDELKPGNDMLNRFVEMGRAAGYEFSKQDVNAYYDKLGQNGRELDASELDMVAGGGTADSGNYVRSLGTADSGNFVRSLATADSGNYVRAPVRKKP